MDFCLLGPLRVCRSGLVIAVPPGSQRVVLAALLLNAGRVVRIDEFAESLWGPDVPPSGLVAVQNYVMRLRKALGDAGRDRIITQSPGYLIRVEAGELDVSRFEALLGAARAAARAGSWDQAAAQAREALELWRGEPLTGVKSEWLAARELPRLAEMRLQAIQTRIDADLHQGRHADVISELRRLIGAHPLRERLHAQLMLALYRDGRQAEALAAYRHARQVLVGELGTEPGADLQELHQRMLSADPALAAPQTAPPAARGTALAVPRELPAGVRHFTGRADELHALTCLLNRSGDQTPGTVVISAIGGAAGVGKTALAVHWAHQVAAQFPDGQLYVNLRGYDPAQPVAATDALAGFLRALGVGGLDIPAGEDERAALYRSILVGRRMLVVLDNAGSPEQVRPLLPGTSACFVVVTSRDALAGLVARDGAHRLDLDLLPLDDAVGLLRELIGTRASADAEAVVALSGQCCRLPLALRVAAELAAARPDAALADLVAELGDQQRRLDVLDAAGDQRTAVRAVFSWSYYHLAAGTARAFRLASLHIGPDFDHYAIAALAGTSADGAARVLAELGRAHLIQPAGPGRYWMHDLLRAYARELADAETGGGQTRAALNRLFDYYVHTAAVAVNLLYQGAPGYLLSAVPPPGASPLLPSLALARKWLDAERSSLVAAVAYTAQNGWQQHATCLAAVLLRCVDRGDCSPEADIRSLGLQVGLSDTRWLPGWCAIFPGRLGVPDSFRSVGPR